MKGKKPTPSHQQRMMTHTERDVRHKGRSDVSSDSFSEEENCEDWKVRVSFLEKENLRLKNKVLELNERVETLTEEQEEERKDVIRRSQMNYNCDAELYKRINDFARKKLFRHVKFITSERMINDLESKTSLGNVTMNHFNIDERDRIAWWRACSGAVTDAVCNQRSSTAQAIKAQVLGKYIITGNFLINGNSPFCWYT